MATNAKLDALQITINGFLDPSLIRMINRTEAELKRLGASVKTQNAAMNRLYAEAFSGAEKATRGMDRMHDSMQSIFEISAGVSLGEFLAKGMEGAIHLIERATEGLKEFAKGALEVRAERESLQLQQKAFLSSKGISGIQPGLEAMLQSMPGKESMMPYNDLLKTSNLLMNASPERFANVEGMHKMLKELSEVSRDPQSFALATQAVTRILAQGKVDQRHINEMGVDTGYAFKQAMAEALSISPDDLSKMVEKHKLGGKTGIDALLKGFDILTGPGGAAYGHIEAQLSGLKGIFARSAADWANFQASFGEQLENFIRPIANRILPILEDMKLNHFFDGMADSMKSLGVLIATLDFSKEIMALRQMGVGIGEFFKRITGGFDPQSMLKEIYLPYGEYGKKRVFETTAAYDAWHESVFGTIDGFLNRLKEIGTRLDAIGQRLAPLLKLIDLLNQWNDILYSRIYPALEALFKFIDDKLFGWLKILGINVKAPTSMTDHSVQPGGNRFNVGGHVESDADRQKTQEQIQENGLRSYSEIQKTNDLLYELTQAWWTTGPNVGGNFGLHGDISGGGSLQGFTVYGPGVKGDDVPHQGTWDADSYNRIGHIFGKPYHLESGDAAMKAQYARGHYHIEPGEIYRSDKDGKLHHWKDTSGAKNPENEDIFVDKPGASVTIHNHIYAMDSHGVDRVMREHGESIAEHIRRVWDGQEARSAVV